MSKKCISCGAELPEGATFCPHCEKSQIEKSETKPPKLWRKKALIAGLCSLVVIAVVAAICLHHAPKTYEGGAEITYTDRDGTSRVLLSFSVWDGVQKAAQSSDTVTLEAGARSAKPSQLAIEGSEAGAQAAFMEKVSSCTVETIALDGGNVMEHTAPAYDEDFPYSAATAHIFFSPDCGTNEIRWTLHMKNGDTIILRQTITVELMDSLSYYADDYAMDTVEDLQALLETINQEVSLNTVVNLYLPAVVYDGGITIETHGVNLYGSTENGVKTTFTGTVFVQTDTPGMGEINAVVFRGAGGTGLCATGSVYLMGCEFYGWDVGAIAKTGGNIMGDTCRFEENKIGLKFDTGNCHYTWGEYMDMSFIGNEIGIQITELCVSETLTFTGSSFSGNGVDVDNPAEHDIDLSQAIFE